MNSDTLSKLTLEQKRRALARLVEEGGEAVQAAPTRFPLTPVQEAFLVGRQYSASSDRVGCHAYFEVALAEADVERLHASFRQLVALHPMLRTVVHEDGTQEVLNEVELPAFVESSDPAALRARMSHRVYEPGQWPLFELALSRANGESLLHVSIDEWIADAASISLLMSEWQALYERGVAPEAPIQTFAGYVAKRPRQASAEDLEYFLRKLGDGSSGPELPVAERPRQSAGAYLRERLLRRLDPARYAHLKQLCRQHGVSPTAALLTMFADWVRGETGTSRFTLTLTMSERSAAGSGFERVIGPMISTGLFVAAPARSFLARAEMAQSQLWADLDHASSSGVEVLRELKRKGQIARDAVFPVVFTSMLSSVGKQGSGWFEQQRYGVTQTPQVWLDAHVIERGGTLELSWDVALGYFGEQRAQAWFDAYLRSVEARIDQPSWQDEEAREWPLSAEQQALVLTRLEPDSASTTISQEFRVFDYDHARFERALWAQVAAQPLLRAAVSERGTLAVLDDAAQGERIARQCCSEQAFESEVARSLAQLASHRFELGKAPGFAIRVIEQPDTKVASVQFVVDPVVFDGRALQQLYVDVFRAYAGLPAVRDSFALARAAVRREVADARAYWTCKFVDFPAGPALRALDGERADTVRFAHELCGAEALTRLARSWNVRLDALLATTYLDTLAAFSEEPQFSVVVVDWRDPQREGAHALGFGWLSRAPDKRTLREQVEACQQTLREDAEHSTVSGLFGLRAQVRKREARAWPTCVYTALLPDVAQQLPAEVELGRGGSSTPGVALDSISLISGDRLSLHWDARPKPGREGEVERMFEAYVERMQRLVAEANRKTTRERNVARREANTLHGWFEDTAARFPERIAVRYREHELSYDALNRRANQLARHLRAQGIGPGAIVGLCLERTLDVVVAILGVLKSGAAYLPLDVHYPKDRVRAILEDAQTKAVITTGIGTASAVLPNVPRFALDEQLGELAGYADDDLEPLAGPSDAAYVIYTSGSTGKPKGVVLEHRNATRLFTQTEAWYGFDERDVWTLYHSYAFDFSVWEIWGALLYGGRLIVVPYETSRAFDSFHRVLVEEGVTVLNQTPTAFRYFQDADLRSPDSMKLKLRYVIFGGEKLELRLLKPWFARHGEKARLVNMYGITETTVHVTYRPVLPSELHLPSVIGEPIPDLELEIFDAQLEPVPIGEIGELYVGGPGVARGYLNRPELTAERFLQHQGRRLYKTGDLARRRSDGELEFIGRSDHQVQLRGFRIELGEVEAVIASMPEVQTCVVQVLDEHDEDPKMVAGVVPRGKAPLSSRSVRHFAQGRLPEHMVPNRVVTIAALPLTPEGKLDRRELARLLSAAPAAEAPTPAPAEPLLPALIRIASRVLKTELSADDDMLQLGATSLSLVNLLRALRTELNVEVPLELLLETCTLAAIARHLEHSRAVSPAKPVDAEMLLAVMREVLKLPELGAEDDLFDAGATSLGIVNVARKLEREQGLSIPVESFLAHASAASLARSLAEAPAPVARPVAAPDALTLAHDARFHDLVLHGRPAQAGALTAGKLAQLLALFAEYGEGAQARRLYASAGGKYAVELWLRVGAHNALGLSAGTYRYDPLRHGLEASDRQAVGDGELVLLFAARLDVLTPTYGGLGLPLSVVETGYMLQLAEGAQHALGLSLAAQPVEAWSIPDMRLTAALAVGPLGALTPRSTQRIARPVSLDEARIVSLQLVLDGSREPASRRPPGTLACSFERPAAQVRALALRQSQREWSEAAVGSAQLAGVLELVRLRMLSVAGEPLLPVRAWSVLVYVREGAVEGIPAGLYRYAWSEHQLVGIGAVDAARLKSSHAPFNRRHFAGSAFSLYFVADGYALCEDPSAAHNALLEAGQIGQLLMENQSAFGIGLTPIGGQSLDVVRAELRLASGALLLHGFCGGARSYAQPLERPLDEFARIVLPPVRASGDVAIVGVSARLPGGDGIDAFWQNLREGRDCTRGSRDGAGSHAPAGYLDDIRGFDADAFQISPAEAKRMDPQERLVLESVQACLEDAGYHRGSLRGCSVGVFVAAMWADYDRHQTADAQPLASLRSSMANRVSWFFDFQGPSIAVETACSSSLTALKLARDALFAGECDVAVVSGVNLLTHADHHAVLAGQQLLAQDGVGRAFSADGSGLVPGEGVASVVLKRAPDAERDHVYGLLRGIAINHGGRTRRFGMPKPEQQARAMARCLEQAGLTPHDVSYVESAATGSTLADAAELGALASVFGQARCIVGSLKPNIGHLESASTMSQLIKVLAQLRAREIAPTIHAEPLNPLLPLNEGRTQLALQRMRWDAPLRRVLINSYGALGSNGSLLIEEAPAAEPSACTEPMLIALSAPSESQLLETLRALRAQLDGLFAPRSLADVAYTLRVGREQQAVRAAFVVRDLAELRAQLDARLEGRVIELREASAWLQGGALDAPIQEARRTPLPGYAFVRKPYWVETSALASAPAEQAPRELEQAVLERLMGHYVAVSELPYAELDPDRALEDYGLSSLQVVALTKRMAEDLVAVPDTLWFECRSLRDVSARLVADYGAQLAARFALPAPASRQETASAHEAVVGERDLAVIGLAGRYPGADDVHAFWRNLCEGIDAVREVPPERWRNPEDAPRQWGGFLSDVEMFDPLFFKMSRAEAELTDPQERLFLQTAWQAIEDAGYSPDALRSATSAQVGVFVGVMYSEYQLLGVERTQRGAPIALGSSPGSVANRVSYFLDLRGPSMTIDTMCSSSLVALHLAAQAIERGECKAALVGGVNLSLHPNKYRMQTQMNMLSPRGRCSSFGSEADGFVPAETVAAVLVKPLSEALRAGDHIYGVIKGTAVNHDGKTNGYTVPNPQAQAELVSRAHAVAGVSADSIGYIEAHGTGTALGDPIEVAGLNRAFAGVARSRIALGSVKSNIGHAEAAAGMSALSKVLLQLSHRQLVPSLHCRAVNPKLALADSPLRLQRELSAWHALTDAQGAELPRRAGISSFGAGGVNAHVVLEEAPARAPREPSRDKQLLVLSARSEPQLRSYAIRLHDALAGSPRGQPEDGAARVLTSIASVAGVEAAELRRDVPIAELGLSPLELAELSERLREDAGVALSPTSLAQRSIAELAPVPPPTPGRRIDLSAIAYTLQVGRESFEHRMALVARDIDEALTGLAAFARGEAHRTLQSGQVDAAQRDFARVFAEVEGHQFLALLAQRGRVEELAKLWVRGIAVDFRQLHGARTPERVSLPSYPFAKQRCWVADVGELVSEPSAPIAPVVRLQPPTEPSVTPLQWIRSELASLLGHAAEQLDLDLPLLDLGYDSVTALRFKQALERRTEREVPLEVLDGVASLRTLSEQLARDYLAPEPAESAEEERALVAAFDRLAVR